MKNQLYWACNARGMIEFFPPILENFCPLFILIAQMGLISPRWGLILPRIPPPTPVLYLAVTHPFWRYVPTQNTINPPKNTPFPVLNLKVGKMNYNLGNLDPNWAKHLKSEQNFSRNIHVRGTHKCETCHFTFLARQPFFIPLSPGD